jgi:transposase
MAVDAHGMPVRILVTAGPVADCTQAEALIENIQAQHLLADRAYDTDAIIDRAQRQGMQVVIPAKSNRKNKRDHDKALYKHRHLIENAFYHLKRWRGLATRYAKNAASFLAAAQIRCLAIWIKIS